MLSFYHLRDIRRQWCLSHLIHLFFCKTQTLNARFACNKIIRMRSQLLISITVCSKTRGLLADDAGAVRSYRCPKQNIIGWEPAVYTWRVAVAGSPATTSPEAPSGFWDFQQQTSRLLARASAGLPDSRKSCCQWQVQLRTGLLRHFYNGRVHLLAPGMEGHVVTSCVSVSESRRVIGLHGVLKGGPSATGSTSRDSFHRRAYQRDVPSATGSTSRDSFHRRAYQPDVLGHKGRDPSCGKELLSHPRSTS